MVIKPWNATLGPEMRALSAGLRRAPIGADPRDAFLAAQQADIHRWIMLARGVVVPQCQARRAVALPPRLVGETIRAAVTDTDRQILKQHAHRHRAGSRFPR